ncbi:MAG: LON peptidase substrate-binding domain-containing protein [Acidimicrobiales bacterium]
MRRLPLFPLGTVLMPTHLLPLHVFEQRYRALLDDLTGAELGTPLIEPEFGVVLIERGHEVGGGDRRAPVGTVARLLDTRRLPDGRWVVAATGTRRFRVDQFLPDDPYPLAMVDDIPDDPWDPADAPALAAAEAALRRTFALATRLATDPAGTEPALDLSDEPPVAAWQLCGLAPVGPLDQYRLLVAETVGRRLDLLTGMLDDLAEMLAFRLAEG